MSSLVVERAYRRGRSRGAFFPRWPLYDGVVATRAAHACVSIVHGRHGNVTVGVIGCVMKHHLVNESILVDVICRFTVQLLSTPIVDQQKVRMTAALKAALRKKKKEKTKNKKQK